MDNFNEKYKEIIRAFTVGDIDVNDLIIAVIVDSYCEGYETGLLEGLINEQD